MSTAAVALAAQRLSVSRRARRWTTRPSSLTIIARMRSHSFNTNANLLISSSGHAVCSLSALPSSWPQELIFHAIRVNSAAK